MPVEDGAGPSGSRTSRSAWIIVTALIMAELLSSFESGMIYAALARLYKTFHDPIGVGWLVTGYMLVACIAAAICARLGDMYGRRRVLLIVIGLAGVGSLISATSESLSIIIVGRGIQGFAGSILPLCYGLVREHLPANKVSLNIGIISATASAGAAIGMILGGVLVDHGSWRMIFTFSAGLAVIAAIMVATMVPPSRKGAVQRIDWIGAALFIVGLWLTLYALSVGESVGWGGRQQIGYASVGLTILLAWYFYEYFRTEPMINVRLFSDRRIGLVLVIFALVALGTMNASQIIQVMLQQPVSSGVGYGISATLAGILKLPGTLFGVVASPIVGWYAGRHGARNGVILATAVLSMGWFGLMIEHRSLPLLLVWLALHGFGLGAIMAAAPNLIVAVVPADRTSETTGLTQIVRKIAMACGAQMIAISMATSTVAVEGGVYPSAASYALSFGLVTGANVLALVLSFFLPKDGAPDRRNEAAPFLRTAPRRAT